MIFPRYRLLFPFTNSSIETPKAEAILVAVATPFALSRSY